MTQPDYLDIAENARDALALLEACIRRDAEGASAVVANANGAALVEHLAAMVVERLIADGIDPLHYVAVLRARLAVLGDDAVNLWGEQ